MEGGQQVDEDFVCPVCYLTLLEPTTLTCGHTVCRGCLATWYLSNKPRNDVCPVCRQKWEGCPQVNTTLRNLIERLQADNVRERQREMDEDLNDNYRRKLVDFENELKAKQKRTGGSKAQQNAGFFAGVIVAVVAVSVIYCFFLPWGGKSDSNKGTSEIPVEKWSVSDVAQWLNTLGWARNYSQFAVNQTVDGLALLNMETTELMDTLHVTDTYHQSAFHLAVDYLRESGVRMPQTVWEYKALYPGHSLYLSYAMKEFPRCTMVYLYLFDYEDSFLPVLHTTVPKTWDETLQLTQRMPTPTWPQFLMFCIMMLVFPYGMIGLFAWSMRFAHTFTHLFVIVSCFFHTIFELSFFSSCFLHGRWLEWTQFVSDHKKKLIKMVFYLCLWPVMPSFLGTLIFYVNVFYTPLQLAKQCYQILVRPQN